MNPDALPVTRRGVTCWESKGNVEGIAAWAEGRRRAELAVSPADLNAMDRHDMQDPLLAALGVLDVKLAVVIADQERLLRLLERVAGVVDVRLVTP